MTEQWIPSSKSELLSAIEHEWQALMQVIAKMDERQLTTPDSGGWSPKDNLAHLSEWMTILMGYHMDKRPSHEVIGVSPDVTEDWDMEVINPILFERNRERSMDEVMNDIKRVYAALVTKLTNMPFDDLMQPRQADDPEKRPLLLWVLGDTTEHFAEHRETMEKHLNN